MAQTTILFRLVGQQELELMRDSGYNAFPPRLPYQPIFYPVLSEAYAAHSARDGSTKDAASGDAGYVTRFHVQATFTVYYAKSGQFTAPGVLDSR
jgi:hypothetical protein